MIAPARSLPPAVPAILSRRALPPSGSPRLVASAACDKVPLTAPTGSTVTLFSNTTIVPVNGAADITATVIEAGGTLVQNGTLVTFTTTIGQVDPAEARTRDGKVTVRLVAGARSGRAVVRAFSGGITSGDLVGRHRRRRRRLDQPQRQPVERPGHRAAPARSSPWSSTPTATACPASRCRSPPPRARSRRRSSSPTARARRRRPSPPTATPTSPRPRAARAAAGWQRRRRRRRRRRGRHRDRQDHRVGAADGDHHADRRRRRRYRRQRSRSPRPRPRRRRVRSIIVDFGDGTGPDLRQHHRRWRTPIAAAAPTR